MTRRAGVDAALRVFAALGCAGLAVLLAAARAAPERRVLDARRHHLGTAGRPEWEEFARDPPEGRRLDIRFQASANHGEQTLLIRQRDVRLRWEVELNGRSIGVLQPVEHPQVAALAVAAGTLRDGENRLSIVPPGGIDDVVAGPIELDTRPLGDALGEARLEVAVSEMPGGAALPCRITVADGESAWAPIVALPGQRLALRPGVVYTGDGRARIGLPAGDYTVYCSRGLEYGVSSARVSLARGERRALALELRREVATPGLVACDTHVHTLTFSHHGDCTVEERVLTLAGEGVELPVITEHNAHVDYGDAAARLGVARYFTAVRGNEVTTPAGHFNIFPVAPGSAPPDARGSEWATLLKVMRAVAGVEVVVLNHPRDSHGGFRPFADADFNPVTGASRRGLDFGLDALETTNSGALRSDILEPYRDWLALLNRGLRVTAVGSSDSHDVSRSVVGQSRTYVASRSEDPARIDVEEACRNLRAGKALVSLGLLVDIRVEDRFGPGDLAVGLGDELRVQVTVSGPSWSRAGRVDLYCDGAPIREQRIDPGAAARAGEKARFSWTLPRPWYDAQLVAIATGPGASAPFWPISKPYQPTSLVWAPRVLGATNPVRIDGDGDGVYTSPRQYALVLGRRRDPAQLVRSLAAYDEAVAVQAFELFATAGGDLRSGALARAVGSAPPHVSRALAACLAALGKWPQPAAAPVP